MNRDHQSPARQVAIIGGGVIGLSIGWRLAAAGATVTIHERTQAGRAASWAAAGMLAAGSEVEPGETGLLALTLRSQSMWSAFASELGRVSGIDVGLRTEGTLAVALTADDLARLRQTHALQQRVGVASRWLNRDEVLDREPHLNPRLNGGLLVAGDHQVDNRLLVDALKQAFLASGGHLREGTGDVAVQTSRRRAFGVVSDGIAYAADRVIVAAGAWSSLIQGVSADALPPVRPVKGQMLALEMDAAAPLLNHVLWAPKAYLVPRRDGRLIIGATTEERGFDPALTAGAMLSLLEAAWRVLPGIEELPVVETWVGFRPGSRDDAPILGVCDVENLILATGHHRNGILLAPVTAEAIASLVLTGTTGPEIAPFAVNRFRDTHFKRTLEWTST